MQTSLPVSLCLKILKAISADHTDQSVGRSVSDNPKGNLDRPYRPVCQSVCPLKILKAISTDHTDQSVSRSVSENPKGNLDRPYRPVCQSVCPLKILKANRNRKSIDDIDRSTSSISSIDRRSIDRSDRSTRTELNYLTRASKSKSKIGRRRVDVVDRRRRSIVVDFSIGLASQPYYRGDPPEGGTVTLGPLVSIAGVGCDYPGTLGVLPCLSL